jgi:hypothetical protein
MEYILFICRDSTKEVTPELGQALGQALEAWEAEMTAKGVLVQGQRLDWYHQAKTVRRTGDEMLVTDGPFTETKEHIAGFDVVECASMDEALEVASHHPMLQYAAIEVRAFWTD